MKVLILFASPRPAGNTAQLLAPFMETLRENGAEVECMALYEKNIQSCLACRSCQHAWEGFGCAQKDDAAEIFEKILKSELLVLATPIYAWYCTPPLKALLDRMVYGMNKYYGEEKGPSLWKGKRVALLTTCGYPVEKGADLWEQGVKRYCKHSQLVYCGQLAEHDPGYKETFMDEEKAVRAREFARKLLKN